jgi:hypothetical protein
MYFSNPEKDMKIYFRHKKSIAKVEDLVLLSFKIANCPKLSS